MRLCAYKNGKLVLGRVFHLCVTNNGWNSTLLPHILESFVIPVIACILGYLDTSRCIPVTIRHLLTSFGGRPGRQLQFIVECEPHIW